MHVCMCREFTAAGGGARKTTNERTGSDSHEPDRQHTIKQEASPFSHLGERTEQIEGQTSYERATTQNTMLHRSARSDSDPYSRRDQTPRLACRVMSWAS